MDAIAPIVYAARAAILTLERREAAALAERYARLGAQLADLTGQLSQAIAAAGPDVDAAWLARQETWQRLARGATVQSRSVGQFAATRLTAQGQAMVNRSRRDAQALLQATGVVQPADLDAAAVQALITAQAHRVASYDLPQLLPQLAIASVQAAVQQAALRKRDAARVADRVRAGLGKVLTRLLFLSREEAVTPYRDTSHQVFQANGVTVWQWFAEIEQPTPPCGMCVALHGRTFPIATALATHPGCRCLAVPVLTLATPPVTLDGQAWFDRQDAATQRAVLGPGKLAHYTAGALTLDALIGDTTLPDGRAARQERSLQALGLGPTPAADDRAA